MKLYIVYILQCSDSSYYVGMTSDLVERMNQHNSGEFPEAYTYKRRPVKLQWIEQFADPDLATALEKQIKGWSRKKKEALISEDWEKLKEFSRNYTQFGKSD
ncbi:MAG: GIY-YIG nuclease family protein [Gramella sp.]|nr:GIY-YIG nuclease family protein [Christiangramia sp.]